MQHIHRVFGGERFRLVLEVPAPGDIVQVIGEHQAQISERWVARMEGIRCSAIKLLRNQTEIRRATRFKHADDHPVLLAHAPHDLPDRVELTQLPGDVTLNVLEFQLHRVGVERQRPVVVVSAIHGRHLLALGLEETLANTVVPLHRIKNTNRCLSHDNAV